MSKIYNSELAFEADVVEVLQKHGRSPEVIKNPTEKDLIQNWKNILFANNNTRQKLNWCPLTDSEMDQILNQLKNKSVLDLNSNFINAVSIAITRDNPDDTLNCGKEIRLHIYNRKEIAAGSSIYQIVEQPKFEKKNKILPDRRWDILLLINGMPVIHIELKKSWIPVYQASTQIQKYHKEGMFTGIFSLVQIFVAMTPEETLYFANPWNREEFDRKFFFHWADFNNNPINEWTEVIEKLLSIPMAHMLIWFYTIADNGDSKLKVLRSYQYYAANAIANKVSKAKHHHERQKGGFIWHTTGSWKTMTSFKTAQLIAASNDADKVVFLLDRIELWTQTLREYRGFADNPQDVQETENTEMLISKLKSDDKDKVLIVTSIQKMSNISEENIKLPKVLDKIRSKRIVFIIDECHRNTFGTMMATIKETFPDAMFFGFTGTPIFDEDAKNWDFTSSIFGDELHRYSIADGIRDGNVLGFDPYQCLAYSDTKLKKEIALYIAGAKGVDTMDEKQQNTYDKIMQENMIQIEERITSNMNIYGDQFKKEVIKDILDWRDTLSVKWKYSAIFATSSIPDAIRYYQLFKSSDFSHSLKITALFDANIDNNDWFHIKEDGLVEIYTDYNQRYGTNYSLSTAKDFKDNIWIRFARKKQFKHVKEEEKIDILIVVDQMLTGFDSKRINTLYLDKVIQWALVIQAFSRTNRIAENDKPFGVIKYYRKPHTMKQHIERAVKIYAGDKAFCMFVDKIEENVKALKSLNKEIHDLFIDNGVENFDRLPADKAAQKKFENLFRKFNKILDWAKIQWFTWKEYWDPSGIFNQERYQALVLRYKEINNIPWETHPPEWEIELDLDPSIISIDTQKIDDDYMNHHFEKYCVALSRWEATGTLLENLHKTFANLNQDDQRYASIIITDIQSGKLLIDEWESKSFRDFITEYKKEKEDKNIAKLLEIFWVDEKLLKELIISSAWSDTVTPYSKFEQLKQGINKEKVKHFFEQKEWTNLSTLKINIKASNFLEQFILRGGFEF